MTIDPQARANQYTATSRHVVDQAGKIVLDANAEITNGTFTFEKWAKSASQLFDLALSTGLKLVPTMIPYPLPTDGDRGLRAFRLDRGRRRQQLRESAFRVEGFRQAR